MALPGRLARAFPALLRAADIVPGCQRWLSREAPGAAGSLQFCIVGSGPAGFYTADKLRKKFGPGTRVDLVDALPTPFGLVRSGVAPDHADTKNVINQFTALAQEPGVGFLGGVRLGQHVSVAELRRLYHGVVLAYGAESDRRLGVPGEDLPGVLSAREFVWWYNGHPSYAALPIDLSRTRSVAICGLGNVAVDCARVLLQPLERLAKTDIAAHAVEALRASAVQEVHLVGRRGPVQAAFTPKELRELLSLEGVAVHMDPAAFELSPACKDEIKATRMKKRIFDILSKDLKEKQEGDKALHIHFLRNPAEVLAGPEGWATQLKLEVTALEPACGSSGGDQRAVGTGAFETIPADLVLKSIGFKSVGVEGVAFDGRKGVIPNFVGQVFTEAGAPEPGLFVCGWLKRGPSGIIGTNLVDAEQTVATISEAAGPTGDGLPAPPAGSPAGREGLLTLLRERGVRPVSFSDWLRIDAEEVARGQAAGKPREKIVSVEEMMRIAHAS